MWHERVFCSDNGVLHYQIHQLASFQGVGEISGIAYTGKIILEGAELSRPGPSGPLTQPIRFTLTGGDTTQVYSSIFHITVNRDGTTTSYIDHEDITCK